MLSTTETPIGYGELTNTCTCKFYDEETETTVTPDECFGFCYTDELDFFGECVKHLLEKSDWFKAQSVRLWNGDFDGIFHASNVEELVRGMTVNSEWIMRYRVYEDRVEYSLSHHDAPTGSSSVLSPIISNEDEDEEE